MANVENLKQARRLIESVPEHRLHMNVVAEVATCGTAYCLAGWMGVDPWFRANTGMGSVELRDDGLFRGSKEVNQAQCVLSVAQEVLDLDDVDASHLFALKVDIYDDPHAITRDEVLANLDRLIAGQSAVEYAALADYGRHGGC